MGYDADMVAFKKKTLEDIQKEIPDYSFEDLYTDFLFTEIYPQKEEYGFPEDEKPTWISSPRSGIFDEFFEGDFESGETRIIDKETYSKFYHWLEDKLKNTTLYNLVGSDDKDEFYIGSLIDTYKNMRDKPIDFETEFVVFEHDW